MAAVSRKRSEAARKVVRTKGPAVLKRAGEMAVARMPRGTVTRAALSRQTREAAALRGPRDLSRAARKAVRTKGERGLREAVVKAARTRAPAPMKIAQVTTPEAKRIHEGASLAVAGAIMREADCGALPVVDSNRHVVGMITDRDICLALVSKNVRPSEANVGDFMSRDVHSCRPQDDVSLALKIMGTYKVRRLPVCDDDDHLLGILSMDDIILAAEREADGVSTEDVVRALRLICESYRENRLGGRSAA